MNPNVGQAGPTRMLVYCDADLNLIDGSAVWTACVSQVLALHPGARVTLMLKRSLSRSLLTESLERIDSVEILDPYAHASEFRLGNKSWQRGTRLAPEDAAALMADLDQRERFDLILVRGLRLCRAVVEQPLLAGRIWAYLTDFKDEDSSDLGVIHARAYRLLCQTTQLRDHLRDLLGVGDGKFVILPPMIPALAIENPPFARSGEALVYVGKLAPLWNTAEMAELMGEIRSRHPKAELHVAGDKVHNYPPSESFPEQMRRLLEDTPGVIWHRAMSRAQTQELIASCDMGCSWRHPDLDASLELSTKVLEYGAHAKPVLLNRTPMHEDLLGRDYPLFCNSTEEYLGAVFRGLEDSAAYADAARRGWEVSRQFTFSAAYQRLKPHLPGRQPKPPAAAPRSSTPAHPQASSLRVLFAGHDLKFAHQIMASLATRPGVEVRADEWEGHNFHDQSRSRELAEWADIVVAEWCLGNAVWFSHHLPPRTALVIRLHRVELETTYPRELDLDNVHRIIAVSPKFAGLVRDHLPALGDRVVYLPNAVDCALLDKPKLGGSEYRLGLLGGAPKRKRLDLALDMLDALRRRDRRYVLSVKGKLATEYPWAWREQEERAYFHEQMARINHAPWRDSVVFEPFGSDVDVWFRKIGFILSPSDDESFHLSIAEGMAAGSVPIIRRREEVPGLYPPDYVYTDNHQAVALIEHLRQDELPLSARGESLKRWVCDQFDTRVVTKRWHELLVQVYEEVAG